MAKKKTLEDYQIELDKLTEKIEVQEATMETLYTKRNAVYKNLGEAKKIAQIILNVNMGLKMLD